MIGIPHDGKPVTLAWAFSNAQMHPPMNYETRMTIVQGKPVAEAREAIAEAAVAAKCKYLFFNDTDVTIPSYAIRQLIWHLEHYPKYAVAGGIYCHKSPPQMPMVFRGNGIGPYMDWKVGEVFDISGIGMGCTLIRVDVFNKLSKPWFKTVDSVDDFLDGVNKMSMWTEDLWFCHKVTTETDYKLMADGGILCAHWDTQSNTAYELPKGSKPWRDAFPPTQGKKIVDLGSSSESDSYLTNEGTVIRVDIREEAKPDFRCDIRKTPFANGEFDVVFSSHTLEHFSRSEAIDVIEEMIRIMKPGGELRLNLPNIEWAAQHILNGEVDGNVMNVLYGSQQYAEDFHKNGFTPTMLEQLLKLKGFKKFVWDKNGFNMMVRAFMDENAEVPLLNPTMAINTDPTLKVATPDGQEAKAGQVQIHQVKLDDDNQGKSDTAS